MDSFLLLVASAALLAINIGALYAIKEDSTLEKKWPPMPTVDHSLYQEQQRLCQSKWNTLIL